MRPKNKTQQKSRLEVKFSDPTGNNKYAES